MSRLHEVREFLTYARMIIGKITAKAQTTIPKAVRRALGLGPGDEIKYEIEDGRVILTRVDSADGAGPDVFVNNFSTFSEWDSEADRKAFANL